MTYIFEVQCIKEMSHVLPSPVNHFVCPDVIVTFGGEPFFDKKDLRVVVSVFGKDASSASPRGNDIERDSNS